MYYTITLLFLISAIQLFGREVIYEHSLVGAGVTDENRHRIEVIEQKLVMAQPCSKTELSFSVLDKNGNFVNSLTATDFVISLNTKGTEIEDFELKQRETTLPVDIVFLIDGSRGFANEISSLTRALRQFDQTVQDSGFVDARYSLIKFNNKIRSATYHESAESMAELMQELWKTPSRFRNSGKENTVLALEYVASTEHEFRHNAIRRVVLLTDEAFQDGRDAPVEVPEELLGKLQQARIEVYPIVGNNAQRFVQTPDGPILAIERRIDEYEAEKYTSIATVTGGKMMRFDEGVSLQACLHQALTGIASKNQSYYSFKYSYPAGEFTADIHFGFAGSDNVIQGRDIANSSFVTKRLENRDINALVQQNSQYATALDTTMFKYYALVVIPFAAGEYSVDKIKYHSELEELSAIVRASCNEFNEDFFLIASASPEWQSDSDVRQIDNNNLRLSRLRLQASQNAFVKHSIPEYSRIVPISLGRYNPFVGDEFDAMASDRLNQMYLTQPAIPAKFALYRSAWFIAGVKRTFTE